MESAERSIIKGKGILKKSKNYSKKNHFYFIFTVSIVIFAIRTSYHIFDSVLENLLIFILNDPNIDISLLTENTNYSFLKLMIVIPFNLIFGICIWGNLEKNQ